MADEVHDDGLVRERVDPSLEEALERRAHREAGHIELSAHDGVVTLEGRVNSFSDKSVVVDLVRHTPAVRGIDDRLRVDP